MSSSVDEEINAIKAVLSALEPLEAEIRSNVLDYVLRRLGYTAPGRNIPTQSNESLAISKTDYASSSSGSHIKDLKTQKQPRSANEMAALVAYYLANLAGPDQRKKSVNTKDIETYFKIAEFRLPEQIKATLANAKNAGYFDLAGDGEYRLNAVGHNLVAHSMPRGTGAPDVGRKSRKKANRKTGASAKRKR